MRVEFSDEEGGMQSGAETTLLGKIKSTCKGKVQTITPLAEFWVILFTHIIYYLPKIEQSKHDTTEQ